MDKDAKAREMADTLFEKGRYAQALGQYLMAAQDGDKFALYRISMMYYFGLVGERDHVEAYAWATVAQEEGMTVLRQYATLIGQELDKSDYDAARDRLEELEGRYGAIVVEDKKQRRGNCTGSRTGAGCDRVQGIGGINEATDAFFDNEGEMARAVTDTYIAEFNDRYAQDILIEFDQFDRELLAAQ